MLVKRLDNCVHYAKQEALYWLSTWHDNRKHCRELRQVNVRTWDSRKGKIFKWIGDSNESEQYHTFSNSVYNDKCDITWWTACIPTYSWFPSHKYHHNHQPHFNSRGLELECHNNHNLNVWYCCAVSRCQNLGHKWYPWTHLSLSAVPAYFDCKIEVGKYLSSFACYNYVNIQVQSII